MPDDPRLLPVPADVYRAASFAPDPEPEQPTVPLTHYLWILNPHRYKIASFVLASVVCTWVVSKRLTPIYESTATIDIDRSMPIGVVGQKANTINAADDDDHFL